MWSNVADVEPTLQQHWVNVSCLLGQVFTRGTIICKFGEGQDYNKFFYPVTTRRHVIKVRLSQRNNKVCNHGNSTTITTKIMGVFNSTKQSVPIEEYGSLADGATSSRSGNSVASHETLITRVIGLQRNTNNSATNVSF